MFKILLLVYILALVIFAHKRKFLWASTITRLGITCFIVLSVSDVFEAMFGLLEVEEGHTPAVLDQAVYWVGLFVGVVGVIAFSMTFFMGYLRYKATDRISYAEFKERLLEILDKLPEGVEVDHEASTSGGHSWKPLFIVSNYPSDCDREAVDLVVSEVNAFIVSTEVEEGYDDGSFVA